MKKFAMFLLVFFTISTWGQQSKIDSLKKVLMNISNDNKKLETLVQLNELLFNETLPDSSIYYYNKMAIISEKLDSVKLETRAFRYLSEAYMNKMNQERAEFYAQKALKISNEKGNTEDYLLNINQLGRVYRYFQEDQKAIETYKRGIDIYNKKPIGKIISPLYTNLGISYDNVNSTEDAIKCYHQAINFAEKNNDMSAKSHALYCIGNSYMDIQQYQKAENYFLEALKDSSEFDNKNEIYKFHISLGITYSRWGKYDKSLYHYNIANDYYKKIGNKFIYWDMTRNISTLYYRMNESEISLKYADKAIDIAKETNNKEIITVSRLYKALPLIQLERFNEADILINEVAKDTIHKDLFRKYSMIDLYEFLYKIKKGKQQYKKSLQYLERYSYLNDSILKSQRDNQLAQLETKYQTEKKENENLQLKKEKAEQQLALAKENRNKWIFGISLLLSLFTLVVFGYYYRKNQKQKQFIERLQKELHHRVKNNLSIIDSFIEVSKEKIKDPEQLLSLQELQNRIESINAVHQQLYQSQDVTKLELKKYLDQIQKNVAQSFNNPNIEILSDIPEKSSMQVDKSFPVGLIVNEFLTNSFKYAFQPDEKGSIKIQLNEEKDTYKINLSDTGRGLPDDFDMEMTPTFGMRIIKLLTDQLKGRMFISNEGGLHLSFEFPK